MEKDFIDGSLELAESLALDALHDCVLFDPENLILEGTYQDELSAFRAKNIWRDTLENYFMLEPDYDFVFETFSDLQSNLFILRCNFCTACARFAFWRITNDQAPEAQYLIETGHIPNCESRKDEFLQAPDLRSIGEEPMINSYFNHKEVSDITFFTILKKIFKG